MNKNIFWKKSDEILSFSVGTGLIRFRLYYLFFFVSALLIQSCNKADDTNDSNVDTTGSTNYLQSSGTVSKTAVTYTSSTTDISAVKVTGGTLDISNSTISSSGNSSSNDNSSFYGLNAIILASTSSGTATINSSRNKISSTGSGANGIFAYGTATISTTEDLLTHSGGGAHAIMCSGGGIISVMNDTALTTGGSSSTIATDRGGGTITVEGGRYSASGSNSAAIYSTGEITCTGATLTSSGAEALVIEGSNKITLTNCIINAEYNKWGAMLYQSMSGDANGVDGYLTITGGSFKYSGTNGGMFYNTNSTAYISLSGVALQNSCDTLIRTIKGSWGGSTASSGGITHFDASAQSCSGIIHIDSSSKAYLSFTNSSAFTGSINASNTANLVSVTLDGNSSWSLTASSYINGTLTDPSISGTTVSNISGNGFNVYYQATSNPSLSGNTYSLSNGGQLLPY